MRGSRLKGFVEASDTRRLGAGHSDSGRAPEESVCGAASCLACATQLRPELKSTCKLSLDEQTETGSEFLVSVYSLFMKFKAKA